MLKDSAEVRCYRTGVALQAAAEGTPFVMPSAQFLLAVRHMMAEYPFGLHAHY